MPITHASMTFHSRSKGQSAIAGIAYRVGIELVDERTGLVHDYSDRTDVQHAEIMLPLGANSQYRDRAVLWNAVEVAEKRRDSQVAQDMQIALPRELSLSQQIDLTRAYAQKYFVDHGIPADFAIHDHGDGNPHAHIYIATRTLGPEGFSPKKAVGINPSIYQTQFGPQVNKQDVVWSDRWREFQNEFFQVHEMDLEVDANYLIATKHEGRIEKMAHYKKENNAQIMILNQDIMANKPDVAVMMLAKQNTTYTAKAIKRLAQKTLGDELKAEKAFSQIMARPEVSQHLDGSIHIAYTPVMVKVGEALTDTSSLFESIHSQNQDVQKENKDDDTQGGDDGDKGSTGTTGTNSTSAASDNVDPNLAYLAPLQDDILAKLHESKAVFSERDIDYVMFKKDLSPDKSLRVKSSLLNHKDVVPVGIGVDGRMHYTTKDYYHMEANALDDATTLAKSYQKDSINQRIASKLAKTMGLSSEQKASLHYLTSNRKLVNLVGRAGTGKSYLMKAASQMWTQSGYTVLGTSTSSVACQNLQNESGAKSVTIASLKISLQRGMKLTNKHVVILDEAGMVGTHDYAMLLSACNKYGAKLVSVGDDDQLQPIGAGSFFKALINHAGTRRLDNIRRQQDKLDRKASLDLANGKVHSALTHYNKKGSIHLGDNDKASMNHIVERWFDNNHDTKNSEQLILAFTRAEIEQLNRLARCKLIKEKVITESSQNFNGKAFAPNDRILITKNNKDLGVLNGQFGTVVVGDDENGLSILIDGAKTPATLPHGFKDIDYGYATTVHKAQGATIDNVYVHVGHKGWNRHLAYVALTRHRHNVTISVNKEKVSDLTELSEALAQREYRDNVLDFPIALGMRAGFEAENIAQACMKKLSNVAHKIKDKWAFLRHTEVALATRQHHNNIRAQAKWRERAVDVARLSDMRRELAIGWSNKNIDEASKRKLSQLKMKANKLGSELLKEFDTLKPALEANRIKHTTLTVCKSRHETNECLRRIITAVKTNQNASYHDLRRLHGNKKLYGPLKTIAHEMSAPLPRIYSNVNKMTASMLAVDSQLSIMETYRFKRYVRIDSDIRSRIKLCLSHNVKMFENEKLKQLQNQRDMDAYYLKQKFSKPALSNLNIDAVRLGKQADAHTRLLTARHAIAAYKSNSAISADMLDNLKLDEKIFGAIKSLSIADNINQNHVYNHVSKYQALQEAQHAGLDTAQLQLVSDYIDTDNAAKAHIIVCKNDDKSPFDENWEGLAVSRDKAAHLLLKSVTNHQCKALTLDVERLTKFARNQRRRVIIDKYLQTNDINMKTKLGSYIWQQRKTFGFELYKKGVDHRELWQLQDRDSKIKALNALTDNANIRRLVTSMNDLDVVTREYWRTYFTLKPLGMIAEKYEAKTKRLSIQRNRLAQITLNTLSTHPDKAKLLKAIGLRQDKLTQFAKKHQQKRLEQTKLKKLQTAIEAHTTSTITHTDWKILAETVNQAINNNPEPFYQSILGDSYKRQGSQLRYGNKGSLVVNTGGRKQGAWYSFESGTGGGPISLLMDNNYGLGLNFKEAVNEAIRYTSLQKIHFEREVHIAKPTVKQARAIEAPQKAFDKLKLINKIIEESRPLDGTLSERYLTEHRGLDNVDGLEIRHHDKLYDKPTKSYGPGMLIIAKDEHDNVKAIQTILLDKNTANKRLDVEVVKRSLGAFKGSAGVIQHGSKDSKTVIIAEGNETAATLAKAYPDAHIYSTFGNAGNVANLAWIAKKHDTDTIRFAADNDGVGSESEKALKKSATILADNDIKLVSSKPELLDDCKKSDWNDVLKLKGIASVRADINWQTVEPKLQERNINDKPFFTDMPKNEVELLTLEKDINLKYFALFSGDYLDAKKSSDQQRFLKKTNEEAHAIVMDDAKIDKLKEKCPVIAKELEQWLKHQVTTLSKAALDVTINEKVFESPGDKAIELVDLLKKFQSKSTIEQYREIPKILKSIDVMSYSDKMALTKSAPKFDKAIQAISSLNHHKLGRGYRL